MDFDKTQKRAQLDSSKLSTTCMHTYVSDARRIWLGNANIFYIVRIPLDYTVEPRLSEPRSSETSIIRTRDIIILMIFIVKNSTRACAYGQPRVLAVTHWQII